LLFYGSFDYLKVQFFNKKKEVPDRRKIKKLLLCIKKKLNLECYLIWIIIKKRNKLAHKNGIFGKHYRS
jgi:hypothetical protein